MLLSFITIQSLSESIYSLIHILFQALFTSYLVNEAFVIPVELVVYFVCVLGQRTGKG